MPRIAASILGVVVTLTTVSSVQAQSSFAHIKLRQGDYVYLTPSTGPEISGTVTNLSAASLQLDGQEFASERTIKIDRRGDSPWNGLIVGAIVGAVVTAASGYGETSTASLLLGGAVTWGGIGLLIDVQRVGRETVFRNYRPVSDRRAPGAPTGRRLLASIGVKWSH